MIDPKMAASGAQLSASTRRAMARRRKLANTGPKLVNPMNRPKMKKPLVSAFDKLPSGLTTPTESVPRLDGTADNTPGTISRGVSNPSMGSEISRGISRKATFATPVPSAPRIGGIGAKIGSRRMSGDQIRENIEGRMGPSKVSPNLDPKFGMDINKPTKKKAMGKVEEANYGMSKAMDRGVRKALRMPPA